jgi:hypothetical protein
MRRLLPYLYAALFALAPFGLFCAGFGLGDLLDCRSGAGFFSRCERAPTLTGFVNALVGCGFFAIITLPAGFVWVLQISNRQAREKAKNKQPPART